MKQIKPGDLWSRENIAWASGIFEGEGCFRLNTKDGRPTFALSMTMTDEDVMKRFYEIVGVGQLSGPLPGKKDGYKEYWQWRCQKFEDAQAISVAMYPFLFSRRRDKIRECLTAVKKWKKNRNPRGNDLACGYGHSRIEFGKKSSRGWWICSKCQQRWQKDRRERNVKNS